MSDDNREDMCSGAKGRGEISVPPSQLCCKPKTTLKHDFRGEGTLKN